MSTKLIGRLPDPFLKEDGVRMTREEWYASRESLFNKICDIEYGGMPPRPEVVKVVRLTAPRTDGMANIYKVFAGTKERQISFLIDLSAPAGAIDGSVKHPVLLTGDGCYTCCESDTISAAREMGIAVARFNRLEFASDDKNAGRTGGIYDLYPEHESFTAISASQIYSSLNSRSAETSPERSLSIFFLYPSCVPKKQKLLLILG